MSIMQRYKDNIVIIIIIIIIIITHSILQQVHSFFQSDYSTECDIGFPLSISSTFSFP